MFMLIVAALPLLHFATAARILVVVMPDSASHLMSMQPVADRLIDAGHEVTVFYETYTGKLLNVGKIVERPLKLKPKTAGDGLADNARFVERLWSRDLSVLGLQPLWDLTISATEQLIRQRPDDLHHIAKDSWDLILVSGVFCSTGLVLAALGRTPYMVFETSNIIPPDAHWRALGRLHNTAPSYFHSIRDGFDARRFKHRLTASTDMFGIVAVYRWLFQRKIEAAAGSLAPDVSFGQFYRDAELVLYDYPTRLQWPMPVGADYIDVGNHCKPARPVSDDLRAFVEAPGSKGTVVVAFGTQIRWAVAPPRVRHAMLDLLANLSDHRVVWATGGGDMGPLPSHVKAVSWLSQNDLLHHNNTVLFFSHGGLKSLKETICAEVPALYMPMTAEQTFNALQAHRLGLGAYVDKRSFDGAAAAAAMRRLLQSAAPYERVGKARRVWLDRPLGSLDEALFAVERVLRRRRRRPHSALRRGARLPLTTYAHLDLLAFLLLLWLLV